MNVTNKLFINCQFNDILLQYEWTLYMLIIINPNPITVESLHV